MISLAKRRIRKRRMMKRTVLSAVRVFGFFRLSSNWNVIIEYEKHTRNKGRSQKGRDCFIIGE